MWALFLVVDMTVALTLVLAMAVSLTMGLAMTTAAMPTDHFSIDDAIHLVDRTNPRIHYASEIIKINIFSPKDASLHRLYIQVRIGYHLRLPRRTCLFLRSYEVSIRLLKTDLILIISEM